ncbi:AAA family ATPase [Bacillus thuringiensis]|uniref:AAA family ATPase n=1 Tax=Bacillus thuringiensis TaxID=1428 RepID=UPI0011A6CD99|nr:AAA family ATPase [Bacillus thuringiensis]
MELLYIYVKEFNNILKDKEFNFGGIYTFQFNCENEKLYIKKNPNFMPGFFSSNKSLENENILKNVTAIIGENGAGKSSLLNFLKSIFTDGDRGSSNFFAIFLGVDNVIYIYTKGKYALNFEEQTDIRFEIKNVTELPSDQMNIIYYSSIFDVVDKNYSFDRTIKDISTTYLLNDDMVKYKDTVSYTSQREVTEIHRMKEIERQVNFISSNKREHFKENFGLPEELVITFSLETRAENFIKQLSKFKISKLVEEVLAYLDEPVKKIYKTDEHQFMWKLTKRVVQHLIMEAEITSVLLGIGTKIPYVPFKKLKDMHPLDSVLSWLLEIVRVLKHAREAQQNKKVDVYKFTFLFEENFDYAIDIVEGLAQVLITVDKLIWSQKVSIVNEALIISLKTETDAFKELQNRYQRTIGHTSFLNFAWRDLSSGEKAMLNLYARFYSLISNRMEMSKNSIILIDEGELYFHPQWQKKFLKNILTFLEDLFSSFGTESIQVIIASNSPFIVSDLPSSHIIFLKKANNSIVVMNSLEEQHQTFAANIHSLLAHSFFLQDGLFGEFAKDKINCVIKLLLSGTEADIDENLPQIRYIIKNLGEPILKNKIAGMLQERQKIVPSDIEKRVLILEEELANLRKEIRK